MIKDEKITRKPDSGSITERDARQNSSSLDKTNIMSAYFI